MTARQPCPPAPGPLEGFALLFDALFGSLGQRRSFRGYLGGLLAPRDRNKTLTALAGAEPLVQAQSPEVQRLQYFLAEADWSAEALNARRLELLQGEAATAAHREGVLVLDDTGDRKDGTATAHVGRQYLGSVGKTDNGIVAVTTLWADGRVHYPLHFAPYTPASRFPDGKGDPRFRTKPQIALALIEGALAAGIPFRAVVADCFYGDNTELAGLLTQRKVPYVLAHRGGGGLGWAPAEEAHSFVEAVRDLPRAAWRRIRRHFRDGHGETWWVAELGSYTSARAGQFARSAPPPTAVASHRRRRGISPRTSRVPRSRRSSSSTLGATGPRTPTDASRASSDGQTSRSAATVASAGTGLWSVQRSASAGGKLRARDD
jgi:SRSO17 transposase